MAVARDELGRYTSHGHTVVGVRLTGPGGSTATSWFVYEPSGDTLAAPGTLQEAVDFLLSHLEECRKVRLG